MGGSVRAWKFLLLVLSAEQNLQPEALADIAIDEVEKYDILRLRSTNSGFPWTIRSSLQWNLFGSLGSRPFVRVAWHICEILCHEF
jgi:hypothetical protein